MVTQGSTSLLSELFLKIASTDINLVELSKIKNAHMALYNLSRYGEQHMREQSTELLTKIAVISLGGGLSKLEKKGDGITIPEPECPQ